jgi:hypothetical protein
MGIFLLKMKLERKLKDDRLKVKELRHTITFARILDTINHFKVDENENENFLSKDYRTERVLRAIAE